MKIYHNPRCSKSRKGLQYLEDKGCKLEIIKYLDQGLTEKELSELIAKTGKKPFDFVRQHEQDYKEHYKGKVLSDEEWIKVLVENPKLLHRPIVVNGDKAVLGNPPENIDGIL
ncbi:arsenate reductase [Draconibacterium orientale]|jgi:arsenate reductase (glutaredoxin)|uniref:Arsenate reductase n=1 Tax=Draconibacterium orientale TaxID=1168034 RepID=X5DHJ3_9BACT|nr:arsenate reductase (glutaredoxin) [Draconibacterium orientale]AHW59947.1 arsenate reductase [Draconibacterium orientale]SET41172.1 arsenate reductase [Draconibacterium orientale]